MDFYMLPQSAPCRGVLLAASALGLKLNEKHLRLNLGEHLTPEFLKINPQHVIPTLVDNGFSVWESRAIMIYLVDKYGKKNDSLYPSDPKTRAVINQRLYFDACTLYQKFSEYYYPQIFKKEPADPAKLKIMETAVEFLDTFLEGQKYAAGGDTLTLADLSLVATIATYEVAAFDLSKYANIKRWYAMCKTEVKGFQINHDGAQIFGDYFK